jgi:hypothetical protein
MDRLLREILELSVLRKAAKGRAETDQPYALTAEFDAGRKAVCFVSTPTGSRAAGNGAALGRIREALRSGELRIIEWDHRALGGLIHLDRPKMEIGIGFEGLENFSVLAAIGRTNPAVLERAIAPALAVSEPSSRADSVG